jgi:hypothetical protein
MSEHDPCVAAAEEILEYSGALSTAEVASTIRRHFAPAMRDHQAMDVLRNRHLDLNWEETGYEVSRFDSSEWIVNQIFDPAEAILAAKKEESGR